MTTLERIKKLSKQRGWSLQTLAEKAGLGKNSIYRWDAKTPSTASLQKVAKVLDVSVADLLGSESTVQSDEPKHIDVDDIVNSVAPLTQRDHALSDEDQAAIRALVKTYLESKEGQNRLRKYGGYDNDGKKTDGK
ncbi:helix-turn-helix domain-containing protein [Lactiplantibacillus argentoratensis]|uniref:Helix-turn-helix transcriptional regulator n=2 Tax=Lactiplantibacillus argentoratensis TaxID=271881 RepID=A0ABS5UGH5_9LACO|nr:helix-turn-helix transcriptional regulator [Lactiplantibacillus argentoratensis]MBT1137670.1 helix-turn-helix transcriptional regulator [Lactiplantibacillus argentoratensis]MBT1140528.1 helix-turn-helix transcriptional regulator [Lactiplantibacillus argentoratensis]